MLNRKLGTLMALAMCMVMALGAIAVPVQAAIPESGHVHLLNNGGTEVVAATSWNFYVEVPDAVGLSADYWNYTVYADNLNTSALNRTFYIHYHINDGTTNITTNVTCAAVNDKVVYANVSIAAASWAAFVTGEGTIYLELLSSAGVLMDSYTTSVSIVEEEYAAGLINILMMIVPVVLIVVLLGWVTDMFGNMGKMFKK